MYYQNIFLIEGQIEDVVLAAVNYFIENPDLLDQRVTVPKTELESAQNRKLTGQIQECLENGQYSADVIKQLVFERVRTRYQEVVIDDNGFRTEELKAVFTGGVSQVQLDPESFRQTIQKIVVGKDNILQIELLNGIAIEVKIG